MTRIQAAPEPCEGCDLGAATWLARLRQQGPEAVGQAARVVADNPVTMAVVVASAIVATRIAGNVVRPRTATEAAATILILSLGMGKITAIAVERGWLELKLRDDDGRLIPIRET